jgi:cell division transport system permease protein
MRTNFVLQEIWIGLRKNLTMTIALVVTVAIAMALFGTSLLIKSQVDSSKTFWFDKIEVSIFLCSKVSSTESCQRSDATPEQKAALSRDLKAMPQVAVVHYEDKETAFRRAQQSFQGTPAFAQNIRPGDIPDSFRVKLKNPNDYGKVATQVEGRPGVDQVFNERAVLERFFKILNGLKYAAVAIAAIQLIAGVMLIANTMRLSAYNRRRETGIMRLVGASNIYIQLPFVLEGVIAGLVGGLFAAVLLVAAKLMLFDQMKEYMQFATQLGWGAVIYAIGASVSIGVLLCGAASFLTLRRYMKV